MSASDSADRSDRIESWLASLDVASRIHAGPSPRKRQKTSHHTRSTKLPTPSDTDSDLTSPSRMDDADQIADPQATRGIGESDELVDLDEVDFTTPRRLRPTAGPPTTAVRLPPPPYPGPPTPSGSPSRKRPRRDDDLSESPARSFTSAASDNLSLSDSVSRNGQSNQASTSEESGFLDEVSSAPSKLDDYAIDNLDQLNPPIDLTQVENWLRRPSPSRSRTLPPQVQKLYDVVVSASREHAAIPFSLRAAVEAKLKAGGQAACLPSTTDYKPSTPGSEQLDALLWNTVKSIRESQLEGLITNETKAVEKVITPLLQATISCSPNLPPSKPPVKLLNLQSTAIHPQKWIPRDPLNPSSRSTGRLIDLALSLPITLSPPRKRKLAFQCRRTLGVITSLNHMKPPEGYQALFAYVEAKTMKSRDPRSQLCVWAAAGHLKAAAHEWDVTIPRVGLTIVGGQWAVWLVFWDVERGMLAVLGPWTIGATTDEVAILRLAHVLRAIVDWGMTDFKEMHERGVLERLD